MKIEHTYPPLFKWPMYALCIAGTTMPLGAFLFVLLLYIAELAGYPPPSTMSYDPAGLIPMLVITLFLATGGVTILSLFPEFEIKQDRFRLITLLSKSDWYSVSEVKNFGRPIRVGRWGRLISFEIANLPAPYKLIQIVYGLNMTGAFIHPKISSYDELFEYLQFSEE